MTWEDHVKETKENHNIQKRQDQGSEEEGHSPKIDRGLLDVKEDIDLKNTKTDVWD
jgi:hypothetical protein